jgi:hypothetical protein
MGAGRKSREEMLQEEHDKWLREVEMSEMPAHIAEQYGIPHINLPPDEEEEIDDLHGE